LYYYGVKLLLSLGAPNPIEDVEIIQFGSEQQLIIGFTQMITNERPNVVLGYNSFGFDLRYYSRSVPIWQEGNIQIGTRFYFEYFVLTNQQSKLTIYHY
jgi:hypothetical protein